MNTNHEAFNRYQHKLLSKGTPPSLCFLGAQLLRCPCAPPGIQTGKQRTCQVSEKGLNDHLAPPSGLWSVEREGLAALGLGV